MGVYERQRDNPIVRFTLWNLSFHQRTACVFEPRYKQMLDDCTLNEGPFGYIAHDPDSESIDGWSQPGLLVSCVRCLI